MSKEHPINNIVIVGGGTAGWLTAALLGAEFAENDQGIRITLIESPGTPPIGVGEGTWPSMRSTLKKIGLSETLFFTECEATPKQGTWFKGWLHGADETYYHPFTLPTGFSEINLAEYWLNGEAGNVSFAEAVTPQFAVCEQGLAPKQISVPEYAFTLNYGYHLDAGRFASLLQKHAVETLGISHILDDVIAIENDSDGDIAAVQTQHHGAITGQLFVDCSGFRSLLLGEHFDIPMRPQKQVLFNDRALAVQVPYSKPEDAIASATRSTAQAHGWIWDIGLQHRRGVGYVHASDYCSEDEARTVLDKYLRATGCQNGVDDLTVRTLTFEPGYREKFWHRNCVAIGLSAGFIEPLEASALVLVELSARALAEQMPVNRSAMDIIARRFNSEFSARWEQIIDFLKLHYVLSKRSDTAYWTDNRDEATWPDSLRERLDLWRFQCPWHRDDRNRDDMFPAASYQYILYGMDFKTQTTLGLKRDAQKTQARADALFSECRQLSQRYTKGLPPSRQLMQQVRKQGFAKL